ncbi:MAG: RDD family protein [Planctomycetota bacterium]|nr:RDD family protein [Planctomycetota bacterium]
MPKVRCGECGLRFDAPNEARGKSVKCPDCDSRVRVPRVKKKAAAPKQKRPASGDADGDESKAGDADAFLDINLARIDDDSVRICPKCTKEVDDEDVECPYCGVNLETGSITAQQKKKFSRRGPDPDEFLANLWGDSFGFMGRQWKLALRTTLYFSVFITGWFFCAHMTFWSTRMPPKVFWTGVGFLFLLGPIGWLYHLNLEVIRACMSRKRDPDPDDIKFDLFQCISMGIRFAMYPIVLFLPFFWTVIGILVPIVCLPISLAHMTQKYTYRGWLGYFQIKIFMQNAAATMMWFLVFLSAYAIQAIVILVLMLTSVQAKIYTGGPPEKLAKAEWRQPGALPDTWTWVPGGFVGRNAGDWAKSISGVDAGFTYQAMSLGFVLLFIILFAPLIASAFAWPSMMVARASALFAYYRQTEMEFITEHKDREPTGYWARYLATKVDGLLFMMCPFIVAVPPQIGVALWSTNVALYARIALAVMNDSFGIDASLPGYLEVLTIWLARGSILVNFWVYFAVAESNFEQATVGKAALGFVVSDEDNNRLTLQHATGRTFAKLPSWLLGVLAGWLLGFIVGKWHEPGMVPIVGRVFYDVFHWLPGGGILGIAGVLLLWLIISSLAVNAFAAFNPEKEALHDKMCKTRVKWRGLME